MFHNCCPSLCDNQPLLLDTCHFVDLIVVFPMATLKHVAFCALPMTLDSAFHLLAYDLYIFLSSDFTMFLCLLYRNLFIHAVLMYHIPQEDPRSRVYLTFLFIARSTVRCHDFFASVAAFSAKRLALRSNVRRRLHSAGSQLGQIEVMYTLRHSLPARFSLPWLFILMQITSLVMYRLPHPTCVSNQYPTPYAPRASSSPLLSGTVDIHHPRHERVLRYGGGRQHEFPALDIEPYITAGDDFSHDYAFKFVDHVDSLGQVAYPIA